NRPVNIVFALLALLYVGRFHHRGIVWFSAFPVLLGSLLVSYNLSNFNTLSGGYGQITPFSALTTGIVENNHNGLLGILISPNRGLFVYTPFALFSLWGGILLWKHRGDLLLRYLSLGVIAQILIYGSYLGWSGGWCYGPRYLTDISPFLSFLLVPLLPFHRLSVLTRGLFVSAVLWSVAIQAIGAFYYSYQWDATPFHVDLQLERMWDWRDTQILRTIKA